MNNEQLLDLLQYKPKGLLEQLKYFEYELSQLEQAKGNTEIKRRIRREIENIRHDISVYEKLLSEVSPEIENYFKKGAKVFDEYHSNIINELNGYPYKYVFLLAGLFGASIGVLIPSIMIMNYTLIAISLILLLISAYLFYRKSKLYQLKRGIRTLNKLADLMKMSAEKIEMIEGLKQEIFFAKKREKSDTDRNKHFDKADWLKEKVLEFESAGNSQNKALQLTRELYETEFDRMPPGKTTILRYMGRTI